MALLNEVKDTRINQLGKDNPLVIQVQDTIAEFVSLTVPPPPPPPMFSAPVQPPPQARAKPSINVLLNSGGVPIPPPPPPSMKPCAAKIIPKSSAPPPVDLLQDIKGVGLRRQQVKHDRSDAKAQAACMMGMQKRKIALKALRK